MTQPRGPTFDRVLMRLKDFIIIATAIVALFKWFYVQSQRLDSVEQRMELIEKARHRSG